MSTMYNKALSMMNDDVNNEYTEVIKEAYEYVTAKYGKGALISGGSMLDCLYGKPFYDIDVFISSKDCIVDFKNKNVPLNGIVDVLPDNYEGFEIDVVVVNGTSIDAIKRFDTNIKKIYYNGTFVFTKESLNDLKNNTLTIGNLTRQACLFRYIKTVQKYNLDIDYKYLYLTWLTTQSPDGTILVSNKYKDKITAVPCRPLDKREQLLYNIIASYMKYTNEKKMIKASILKMLVKVRHINKSELDNLLVAIKYY